MSEEYTPEFGLATFEVDIEADNQRGDNEIIGFVITLDASSFTKAKARAVFLTLFPDMRVIRVLKFKRLE